MNFGEDLSGKKFGKLTVLKRAKSDKKPKLECTCECGNSVIVTRSNLVTGNSKSCGCMIGKSVKHGMTSSRIYNIWGGMKSRCSNPNEEKYSIYGGRGITVCEEWDTFERFYQDMGQSYKDRLTIERIDNNKGYSKENCRWATIAEQNRNKSNIKFFEYNGEVKPLKDWAKHFNIKYTTLWMRLYKYNLGFYEAIDRR